MSSIGDMCEYQSCLQLSLCRQVRSKPLSNQFQGVWWDISRSREHVANQMSIFWLYLPYSSYSGGSHVTPWCVMLLQIICKKSSKCQIVGIMGHCTCLGKPEWVWGNLKWSWFWRLCKKKPQFIRHLGNAKNQKKLCLNYFTIQSIKSRVITLGVYIFLQNNSVYSFDKHLLSISCVPDTVLDIRDGAVDRTELLTQGSPSSQGEQQHTNQRVCLPSGGDRCYVEK